MAILKIIYQCLFDETIFDVIMDSFDSITEVREEFHDCSDEMNHVKVLRVMNDEIPKDDAQISPLMIRFEGIRPFIISYE